MLANTIEQKLAGSISVVVGKSVAVIALPLPSSDVDRERLDEERDPSRRSSACGKANNTKDVSSRDVSADILVYVQVGD